MTFHEVVIFMNILGSSKFRTFILSGNLLNVVIESLLLLHNTTRIRSIVRQLSYFIFFTRELKLSLF